MRWDTFLFSQRSARKWDFIVFTPWCAVACKRSLTSTFPFFRPLLLPSSWSHHHLHYCRQQEGTEAIYHYHWAFVCILLNYTVAANWQHSKKARINNKIMTLLRIASQRMMMARPLQRRLLSNLSSRSGATHKKLLLGNNNNSSSRLCAAVFSTKAKSSDNFLSGASSLYAESMLEMYENDPNSVPEVRFIIICYYWRFGNLCAMIDILLLWFHSHVIVSRVGGYILRVWKRVGKKWWMRTISINPRLYWVVGI